MTLLKQVGLKSFVDEEKFKALPVLKSVIIPKGMNDKELRSKMLINHDIEIGGGLGPTKGQIWRFGLMGFNSKKEFIDELFRKLALYIN